MDQLLDKTTVSATESINEMDRINQICTDAHSAMRETESIIERALTTYRQQFIRYAKAQALMSDDAVPVLVGLAKSSGSTYSGGVTSVSNLTECIKRDSAIDLLRDVHRWEKQKLA